MAPEKITIENAAVGVESQQPNAAVSTAQPSNNSTMSKKKKDTPPRVYSEKEKKRLEAVTVAFKTAYEELVNDPKLEVTAYSDHNAIINLTKALADGVDIYMPSVNRTHGRDQKRTGESICKDGAQSLLLVVPVSVAKVAGMTLSRFKNDKKKNEPIGETGFAAINGNGRLNHILGLEETIRPNLYATLVEPNADGYYDLSGAMGAVNEYLCPWKTQDKLTKKIMEMGNEVNPYLLKTRQLVNDGYNYQAACQLTTLRADRISSNQLNEGKWDEIFKYAKEAELVMDALDKRFQGSDSNILKNKPISQKLCIIFDSLLTSEGNDAAKASSLLVDFIRSINDAQVKKIVNCKKDKDNPTNTADIKRVEIINDLFNRFVGKMGLKVD